MLTIFVDEAIGLEALGHALRAVAEELLDRGALRSLEGPRLLTWDGEALGAHALAPWPARGVRSPEELEAALARHPAVSAARGLVDRAREELAQVLERRASLEACGVNHDDAGALEAFERERARLEEEGARARRALACAEEGARIVALDAARELEALTL
jgi:hypothetical protein